MGKPVSAKVKAAVLKRDGGLCAIRFENCSWFADVADHRANRGIGGSRSLDGMSNLISACSFCNGMKEQVHGEQRAELVRRGVRVESAGTHELTAQRARETPLIYPNGRVWLLSDDGSKEEIQR